MTSTIIRRAGVVAASVALVATTAPLAAAKDPEVRTSGTCSSGATWKLKAKGDDGRLEVELEVDSNRVGQTWSWSLSDNGVRVGSGTARTTAPSGSFEVERRVANRAGTDTITATARHAASGQTCRARAVFPG
ncbi:hypothetical protein JQN72_14890 [Phycicoccus sp. CSK15P-2]|uniref:hypothetical protein n=1 Tax=Phycicoccus sp. CSK15P-2 TaxID=2807627 RepID=UPI00194F2992|nr:hypothetical protein [Phycicoccus sp. CSK15P-2]MBM6405530.1 hypothetical protein [Phycicoccus sp. CSK15P-2]